MQNPFKPKSNKVATNHDQQLYNIISKTVIENQKAVQEVVKQCKGLFKQGANPNILTKLEALLREQIKLEKSPEKPGEYQKYHQYYIKHFLPALLREIIQSEQLAKLAVMSEEVKQLQEPQQTRKGEIVGIILTTISKGNDQIDLSSSQINKQDNADTPSSSEGPGSRADLPILNKKSLPPSPVSSRSNNQNKYGQGDNKILNNLNIPKEIREKYSKVIEEMMEKIKRCTKTSELGNSLGSREENKNQMQPEQAIEDTPPEKQHNRNFHIVLVTGCILSAVGCLVAGIITAGAILFAMASAFAAAAVVTWYLTSPSSEFTSTNLSSPSVGGKEYKH
ncbi:hypothetical protein [Wolbachia endosymbiont of Ctenocephalides felis wCfeJ]|uniref:hypothetical protein n=1 Tax=Wolbachia endosymbiont of Ctenocephalides felis wCfeJ TaxID=2732594 RepID=UPI00144674AA|nr:hypothetical protein [Wolbachia endosymbiont of Ctenocephalides felis wCfeJ]WCR57617.1 MAG: hypothetical protein PG980_000089 [Wolbachia endosymbiont of Ctenocephalides felis wCfeJ]